MNWRDVVNGFWLDVPGGLPMLCGRLRTAARGRGGTGHPWCSASRRFLRPGRACPVRPGASGRGPDVSACAGQPAAVPGRVRHWTRRPRPDEARPSYPGSPRGGPELREAQRTPSQAAAARQAADETARRLARFYLMVTGELANAPAVAWRSSWTFPVPPAGPGPARTGPQVRRAPLCATSLIPGRQHPRCAVPGR